MLTIISNPDKLQKYQRQLEQELQKTSNKITCRISTPAGPTPKQGWITVSWIYGAGIWFYSDLAMEENRWWNVFGIDIPESHSAVQPRCEICVPTSGVNRRIAGGFAENGKDIFLIYRGNKYGGSIPARMKNLGMTKKEYFKRVYPLPLQSLDDAGQINEVAVITRLGDANSALKIADFVIFMDKLKGTK
jgi:hypothetical protein